VTAGLPCGCAAYRIIEIPRRDTATPGDPERRGSDPGRPQRVAALVAAYHAGIAGPAGGTVAFGWVRTAAGGPVSVIAAGDALAGSADHQAGEVLLALPGGARGKVLPPGGLAGLVEQVGSWRKVAGISDGLLALAGQPPAPGARPGGQARLSLDEGLLGSWTGPFGWLVVAEPVRAAELRSLAEEVGRRQQLAEGSADRFPERAVAAQRLKERHAEFQRGASTGFWRLALSVGGPDDASAARIAGLLCASADLDGLPYALSPVRPPETSGQGASIATAGAGAQLRHDPGGARDAVLEPGGDARPAAPFFGSTELLAALARPPESEIPGVRLALRPDFDVTPETPPGPGIRLGDILDRNLMPAGPLVLPRDSLNRHVFICGATGAGKSQTVRSLLEAATEQSIPWLVVEPAKAEYRLMAGRLPAAEVIRISPGEPDAIAAGLNPLEPAADQAGRRFPLQTHADLVKALFIASFRAEEPFPQVLSAALGRVYADAGWDLALGERRGGGLQPAGGYPTPSG
jgi:hypothetical protein